MSTTATIARLQRANYPAVRATIGRAFEQYNLMVYAAPRDTIRRKAVTSLYGAILNDAFRHGEVYTLGESLGVACWLPPPRSTPTFLRQVQSGMLALPWHFGLGGFQKLTAYDDVARRLHHDYAPMPHWYLAAIGVEPAHQGQGIGSALMRPMLERADRDGLHCWLDTHQDENVRLYERHGFEVSERVTLPGHPIPVYGMLRRPRPVVA
jgi:ribosomal protein S18 acetylase RimI-like enzyme